MGELPPQVQNLAGQLQQVQQQLQLIISQKAQLEGLIKEAKDALDELQKSDSDVAYRAVGNVLVKLKKEEIEKDLQEKIETYEVRKNMLERQEGKLRDRLAELQEKLRSALGVQAG
ncbi:prefoldin subunit beta [Geoglobus acetivorans]|uniref:Prefoldin subunit beta n=1 Tax=Geoglobus acetivorans TaxID=565033 RepID=A0A0A7GDE3_GEOAI|nr:prefoldin, subunit beta [Geoglobus acetivorans]